MIDEQSTQWMMMYYHDRWTTKAYLLTYLLLVTYDDPGAEQTMHDDVLTYLLTMIGEGAELTYLLTYSYLLTMIDE